MDKMRVWRWVVLVMVLLSLPGCAGSCGILQFGFAAGGDVNNTVVTTGGDGGNLLIVLGVVVAISFLVTVCLLLGGGGGDGPGADCGGGSGWGGLYIGNHPPGR